MNPLKWEYRAKPRKEEGVETRHGGPKSEKIRLRYSPDHKQQLFGSENYSGKKIPWVVMPVRVRVPLSVQNFV